MNPILFPARTEQARLEAMKRHPSNWKKEAMMSFEKLMALPAGTVVVWSFPDDEEWPDVKTENGFRASAAASIRDWIDRGYACREVWRPLASI